jgi:SpoIID/LytB domain protein
VPRAATAATRRAALATVGRIITYKGSAAEVYYSASCGGRSERADAVWPGANLPYLVSVVDDVHEGDQEWTLELTLPQIQEALRANGFAGRRLTDVRIDERNDSGRVAALRLTGLQPDVIAGQPFRLAIGANRLRSTAFSIARRGDVVRFTGRGFGHGVGLCVIGAGRRARRGESADAILAKYYPGLRITTLDHVTPPAPVETAVAPPKPKPADVARSTSRGESIIPAIPSTGIVVRVPRGSNVSARELERMASRARDSLSQSLGTSVAPITIVLHDTVDRFREATGRPWWVNWVAAGTAIDLSPAPALDRNEAVERAVTEAIAELFVAPALANRPAWVRVGAARYFAQPSRPAVPAGKLRCPSDAELTLAISAAAQRDADTRAEACFARAYAISKDWRAVH